MFVPYYVLIILILGLHTLSYRFPACIIPHVRSRSLTKYSQFADDVSIHKRTMRFSSTCVSEWEKTTTIEPTSASDDGIDVEPSASVASVASVNSILAEKFIMMYTCKLCQYRNTNMISKVAYFKGMVVATCKECRQMHLIADNERKIDVGVKEISYSRIGDFLKLRGESVQQLSVSLEELNDNYLVDKDGELSMIPKSADKTTVDGKIVEIPNIGAKIS